MKTSTSRSPTASNTYFGAKIPQTWSISITQQVSIIQYIPISSNILDILDIIKSFSKTDLIRRAGTIQCRQMKRNDWTVMWRGEEGPSNVVFECQHSPSLYSWPTLSEGQTKGIPEQRRPTSMNRKLRASADDNLSGNWRCSDFHEVKLRYLISKNPVLPIHMNFSANLELHEKTKRIRRQDI